MIIQKTKQKKKTNEFLDDNENLKTDVILQFNIT